MDLTPREKDKLLLFTAALVAERRKTRGLKLNHPEAIALISAGRFWKGPRRHTTVAELMNYGRTILTRDEVMDGIPEMIPMCRSRQHFLTAPSWSPFINPSFKERL